MRLLLAGLLIIQTFSVPAHAQQVDAVDVVWAGTYRIAGTKAVEDPTAPTGYRYIAQGVEPLENTDRIPAAIGTRFGVGYRLRGSPAGSSVSVQAFWRFPALGLANPETRTLTFEWKTPELQCPLEAAPFCLMGYPLQHAWELVPGQWTLEIWVEGKKLAERSFEVYLP